MGAEAVRLQEARTGKVPWKKWGPYLSERQWGTVREDYSENGNAWDYFTHDQARSRAYHWGEDGLAGISDDQQLLCFSVSLWNGKDPILKERLFGLTNSEGNHGEDIKEYYFYLDSTPTHSYMKYLYKYPQTEYPYVDLIETNKRRGRNDLEYELLETGVFDEDRYFDVFVEYAKLAAEDLLVQISVVNRGPEQATIHLLPNLWIRNTWTWWPGTLKPSLKQLQGNDGWKVIAAFHAQLGERYLYCEGDVPLLFTENETNNERIFGTPNLSPYVKDGINNYVVAGNQGAVNPTKAGTKSAAEYQLTLGAGRTASRECLLIRAERRWSSAKVISALADVMVWKGVPEHIRSDNGPEFVAKDLRKWLANTGAKTLYIEPGSPWENGYCESFNSKLRDEFLNGEIFYSIKELGVLAERWRVHYNTVRPHSSLGYKPPAPEAWLTATSKGHGEVGSAKRFPLLHAPDGEYLNSEINALH
jgi:hypothetical protein